MLSFHTIERQQYEDELAQCFVSATARSSPYIFLFYGVPLHSNDIIVRNGAYLEKL